MEPSVMEYDVIIVGAGPAGLATAIRLKSIALEKEKDLKVCILEKGAEIGAHIISGAVLEPSSLQELLPNSWEDAPLDTKVTKDFFYYLSKNKTYRLPTPLQMRNHGNYIISLGELCRYLGSIATEMGCEIYPGFPAAKVLYNDRNGVIGVATGDMGIDKNGDKTANYEKGMHLHAKQTIFAEGCRGQLSEELMDKFKLRENKSPQTYGLGIKEVWQVTEDKHKPGHVIHTIGWPLAPKTYGGSFIYHLSKSRVALGFVVGLDYKNPWLSPFEEMQRFKTHPFVYDILSGGERIAYGARAINEGGFQSLPKLTFPGGLLVGDAAGFLNVPKIKGIHMAIKSGILAAESAFTELGKQSNEVKIYQKNVESSWLGKELYSVRNIRPGFNYGLWLGLVNAAFETYISRGKSPWTLANHCDYKCIDKARSAKKISYPKPDGVITFDRLSSVYLTNTYHQENQPSHLQLKDPQLAISVNYDKYHSPETRYCPAQVYEIVVTDSKPKLQINAQNCIHCKTCDIKDPMQNIKWVAPEPGGGPNYIDM